jgi:hypothetical protein
MHRVVRTASFAYRHSTFYIRSATCTRSRPATAARSVLRGLGAPRSGSWHQIPASEKAAWEALGWSEESWAGRQPAPLSALHAWTELGPAEQAAAQHGLQYTHREWDAHHDSAVAIVSDDGGAHSGAPPPEAAHANEDAPAAPAERAGTSSLASAAWDLARSVLPLVGQTLQSSRHPGAALAGALLSEAPRMAEYAPVTVRGLETTLYLDDSGSMTWPAGGPAWNLKTRLDEGHAVLRSMAPLLRGPTRVVKFGSRPTVVLTRNAADAARPGEALVPLTSLSPSLVSLGWDGSSGGTYMWGMIMEDVVAVYKPGPGKLRLVVVTDGIDVHSPPPLDGIGGMDPMMKRLHGAGFDIEWHIVILGRDGELADASVRERYASLAGATGGSFLAVESFDGAARDREITAFLDAVERGGQSGDDAARHERQRRYELETRGRSGPEWFRALPPPSAKQ